MGELQAPWRAEYVRVCRGSRKTGRGRHSRKAERSGDQISSV